MPFAAHVQVPAAVVLVTAVVLLGVKQFTDTQFALSVVSSNCTVPEKVFAMLTPTLPVELLIGAMTQAPAVAHVEPDAVITPTTCPGAVCAFADHPPNRSRKASRVSLFMVPLISSRSTA